MPQKEQSSCAASWCVTASAAARGTLLEAGFRQLPGVLRLQRVPALEGAAQAVHSHRAGGCNGHSGLVWGYEHAVHAGHGHGVLAHAGGICGRQRPVCTLTRVGTGLLQQLAGFLTARACTSSCSLQGKPAPCCMDRPLSCVDCASSVKSQTHLPSSPFCTASSSWAVLAK